MKVFNHRFSVRHIRVIRNAKSVFLLMREFAPLLKDRSKGIIIKTLKICFNLLSSTFITKKKLYHSPLNILQHNSYGKYGISPAFILRDRFGLLLFYIECSVLSNCQFEFSKILEPANCDKQSLSTNLLVDYDTLSQFFYIFFILFQTFYIHYHFIIKYYFYILI